ncbi:MAG TPA: hypothetical protein VEL74_12000 [Thermoanaerobaculia bacterium]|nr:hypothetical protein [Thermoanaerobaculia bacterium]
MTRDDGHGPAFALVENSLPQSEESPLSVRLAAAEAALERERAEAPLLCRLLLSHPPERRPEVAAGDPRFQTWGVGERLLARSLELLERDTAEAEHLAVLALTVARRLGRHSPALVRDLEARAWACAGKARLRSGDLAGAGEALRAAAACLAQGTGDLLVEALLLEFEADVCQAQGHRGEAAALLHQASSRYDQAGDTPQSARLARRRDQLLDDGGSRHSAVPGLGRR